MMKKLGFLIPFITCAYLLVSVLGYLGVLTAHTNTLGWFLLLTAVAFGLSGPYLLKENLSSNKPITHKEDQDRSFWLILPGFLIVFYGAPLEWLLMTPLLADGLGLYSQIIGWIMIACGIALLCWARRTLKDLYSGRIQVLESHKLVQNGPYHYIRHPAYASYILMCLGIGVGFASPIALISIPLFLVPGLVYRIRIEEKLLALKLGEQYLAYSQRTQHIIPRIW